MSERTINPALWSSDQLTKLEDALLRADAIGFDIDHTLAQYKIENLHKMVCTEAAHAVKARRSSTHPDYQAVSGEEFNKLPFTAYLQRGTVYDRQTRAMLKLDSNFRVTHALRSGSSLSDEQIVELYGEGRIFEVAKLSFERKVDNTDRLFVCDNFYDCVANFFFPQFSYIRERSEHIERTSPFAEDISAMFSIYSPVNFSSARGYFTAIQNDPYAYLSECSTHTIELLRALRARGKVLFLLTSSHADYAHLTLSKIFPKEKTGYSYDDLFDAVFCFARKPAFFESNLPFKRLGRLADGSPNFEGLHLPGGDSQLETVEGERLFEGSSKMYIGGSTVQLDAALQAYMRSHQPSGSEKRQVPTVVYFGDSVRSDLAPTKQSAETRTNWLTCSIVPELLSPVNHVQAGEHSSASYCLTDADLENAAPASAARSPLFGDFFGETASQSGSSSFWWSLTRKFSDIIIPTFEYAAARLAARFN